MRRRIAIVLWLACLGASTACGVRDAAPSAVDPDGVPGRQAAPRERLPAQPGAVAGAALVPAGRAPAQVAQVRVAPHAPKVVVEGRGAYADALRQRIRAELPDGWRGAFVLADECMDEDCLRWWMSSADGLQRVEQWPAVRVPVVVPEAGERHVDPRIVLEHAEAVRTRQFPGSKVLGSEYYRYGDRVSNDDITLAAGYMRDGKPMRAEIHVWLLVSGPGRSPEGGEGRTGTLNTHVRSAPAEVFDGDRLRNDVQYRVRLEREGWDAQLDECVARALRIASMAYVGAGEDSRAAEQVCHREWDARRRMRSRSAGGAEGV